jgi:hypothetical protein
MDQYILVYISDTWSSTTYTLCFSEHHTDYLELQQTFLDGYSLGAAFSRSLHTKGGVCILVQEGLKFTSI